MVSGSLPQPGTGWESGRRGLSSAAPRAATARGATDSSVLVRMRMLFPRKRQSAMPSLAHRARRVVQMSSFPTVEREGSPRGAPGGAATNVGGACRAVVYHHVDGSLPLANLALGIGEDFLELGAIKLALG